MQHTPVRPSSTDSAAAPPRRPRGHDEPAGSEELFRRMRAAGPGAGREALRQRLIVAWMPMAERLAARYRGRGESLDDLRQVAAVGLIKAVDRYDPERGFAFASFAVPTVDGEIKRHFRDCLWSVHVPRGVQEVRSQVRAACQELSGGGADGSLPSPEAVAAHTGLSLDQVHAGLVAMVSVAPLSLDAALDGADGQEHGSLGDVLGGCDPAFDTVVDREAVRPRLHRLPERERTILFLRFFRDMKQADIAQQLGISQMHVSRLISRACDRVRTAVMEDPRPA